MMALPVTTHRAARAAAHPLHLVEPDAAPSEQMPQPLVGCMTGVSNMVSEHLARIDLPPKVSRFLRCLERATFGWAGVHRAQGREQPGTWCPFALADWVERTQMPRSQILHIRARLVDDGLIWYEPDAAIRGHGRIGWNLDPATWKLLQPDYPRWGGARPGAGRPRKSEGGARVVDLEHEDEGRRQEETPARSTSGEKSSVQLQEQHVVNLKNQSVDARRENAPVRSRPDGQSSLQPQKPVENSSVQQAEQAEKSSLQQAENSSLPLEAESQDFKMTTSAHAEAAQEAASSSALRRRLRKKKTETPTVVSEALCASSDSLLDLSKAETTQRPPVSDDEAPSVSQFASIDQAVYWPPRQPHERTDLDYYQRVLREREQQRVALLVRLAHERIGVPLERASYARIGALAKQCGAALLVKHILLAAANHIDGNPLDYLTRLARGQQRKEATHATRPTTASSYQPYTAEEASALVWNTL